MYLSIQETADYLELPVEYIEKLVRERRIRALFDGEHYLINQNQFTTHFEQVEKYRQYIQEYLNEPIPEDPDIKDED
ncbi:MULTISPECIES: excisionase family DNA-binding protein [Pontibacillus]|uniref:Excisionase family DNA-binding protein n=1 Tax=Pontibacillus chungwhensis TaxID=265426 RepID=A0ABY8UYX6_9BACI|nr:MULTISPECIES: excisionase family DNA-binding protein [Pontibacillus]MCD5325425.1 excisionase family DNA-binding protein [Pontibacillus sp. HN14]WIF98540.1 excisionase family DNA-binding protein [Pontibacillus chungwhensis]